MAASPEDPPLDLDEPINDLESTVEDIPEDETTNQEAIPTVAVKKIGNETVGGILVVIGKEAFNLKAPTNTVLSGSIPIRALDEFTERFCRSSKEGESTDLSGTQTSVSNSDEDAKIIDTVGKYWRVKKIVNFAPSRSQPESGVFRIPCLETDNKILHEAFRNYYSFLDMKKNEDGVKGSTEEILWTEQKDYISRYLTKLKGWKEDTIGCINLNEISDDDSSILYYSIIPKIFVLLYKNSKQKIPLDVKGIFDLYPTLKEDVKDYMNIDRLGGIAGKFEKERALYHMATGVVELFYFLPKLFPDLYGHLIPDQESAEKLAALLKSGTPAPVAINNSVSVKQDEIDTKFLDVFLDRVKDLLPKNLRNYLGLSLKAALEAHSKKDTTDVKQKIKDLLGFLVYYVEAYAKTKSDYNKANTELFLCKNRLKECSSANTEVKRLKAELETLKAAKNTESTSINKSLLERAAKDGEIIRLQTLELSKLIAHVRALSAKALSSEEDKARLEEATRRLREKQAELDTHRSEYDILFNELRDAGVNIDELKVTKAGLEEELARSRKDVDDVSREAADAVNTLRGQLDAANQKASADAATAATAAAAAAAAAQEAEETNRNLAARLAAAEAESAAARDAAATAQQELERANAAAAAANAAATSANAARGTSNAESAAANAARVAAAAERDAALQRAAERDAAATAATDALTAAQRAAEAAAAEAQAARDADAQAAAAALDSAVAAAAAEARRAAEEAARVARESAAAAAAAELKRVRDEASSASGTASGELTRLRGELAAARASTEAAVLAHEAQIRAAEARVEAATAALAKATSDGRAAGLEQGRAECDFFTKKLYSDIMSNVKGKMVALRTAVEKLKSPSDLPAALDVQLRMPDVAYDETKDLDEQANMKYIYKEIEALKEYLGALNDKYTNWIDCFHKKSKTRTKEKRKLTQEEADAMFKFLYNVIKAFAKKLGNTTIPNAMYRDPTKSVNLSEGLMTDPVMRILNIVLNGITLPDNTLLNHAKFLDILITAHTKASTPTTKTSTQIVADLDRLRRFIMILYKLAYRYVNEFICRDCADAYIDDLYDLFNFNPEKGKKKSMMNTVFNPLAEETTKDIFYLYLISDSIIDSDDTIFWYTSKTPHGPVNPPEYFYNITWSSSTSIKQFYDKMYTDLDSRIVSAKAKPINTKIYKALGGSRAKKEITVSPDDLTPMLAEQAAWSSMNDARNALEPEYQKLLPDPDPAPIHSLVEPFNRYIEENADPERLEEARNAVRTMAPDDVEMALNQDHDEEPLQSVMPIYKKALPRVGEAWIPIMVRADMLKTLLQTTE